MTKPIFVFLACVAAFGVAAAQGTLSGGTDSSGTHVDQNGTKTGKTGGKFSYKSIATRLKLARKKQSEDTEMRLKLGLLGINPQALGMMSQQGVMQGHVYSSERFGSSAISKLANSLQHELLSSYKGTNALKGPTSNLGSAVVASPTKLSMQMHIQGRITGTLKRRLAAAQTKKKTAAGQTLSTAELDLLAKLKAKGITLSTNQVPLSHQNNTALLRGSSTSVGTSSVNNAQSIYHNAAASGSTAAAKTKAKATVQGQSGQSTQNGQQAHSIYHIGN